MKKTITEIINFLQLMLFACKGNSNKERIIGVIILGNHDGNFDELFSEFNELGINTVFIQENNFVENGDFHGKAKQHNIEVYINKQIFMNTEYTSEHKDVIAISSDDRLAAESWMTMICPSREEYRKHTVQEITEYVKNYKPAGISLDFIRHFIFWENIFADTKAEDLPQFCFCDTCLEKFQKEAGVSIDASLMKRSEKADWILYNHEDAFVEWKSSQITSMVKEISESVKVIDPDIKLLIWTVPWLQDEYENGIKRIAGQDFAALAEYVDIFSPMSYHSLMKREASWIKDLSTEMKTLTNKRVVPAIQMGIIQRLREGEFTEKDFKAALPYALSDVTDGIVIFAQEWNSFSLDYGKKEILKKAVK